MADLTSDPLAWEPAKAPSLAAFEVLLRTTSIQANATDTHVIASRIY